MPPARHHRFRTPVLQAFLPLAVPAAAEDLATLSRNPAEWVMPAKNHTSTRFSGLDRITILAEYGAPVL
ncbi:hypothetical protein [Azospirillum sp. ST 5-10]|uniref:hypothetical protein n=1 Tax=unclassified Azospirillum TaxID=2630922 RepID=UPI003F4A1B17